MSTRRSTRLLGRDLAVDLGTATTLVHQRGRGIVLDEPTVVALDAATGRLLAAGTPAYEMVGRTPAAVLTRRPLSDGVITDADLTEQMLRHFVSRVSPSRLLRPQMVVCVPSGVTPVERRALEDAAIRCGARRVFVLEEAMAAAIGADLPVHQASACLVVDIGGGTTDVAVISLGGVVNARSLRVGGNAVDEAVVAGVKARHDLLLGERSAEHIKLTVGAAAPLPEVLRTRVRGRDLSTGLPRTVTLDSTEVREMVEPVLARIVEVVVEVLDLCPPELAGDLVDRGAVLTGGGALLRAMDQRLHRELGLPVRVAEDPQRAVIRGAGACVEDVGALDRLLVTPQRW
ncbi:rod shape-determining protein [Ornithinimicrobium sediminis]|uniref:rod shape-determining protein n=1 Tax=Ornithinimicrobium sediminis TaxID=2904603 RepID=UPI001E414D3F|nr:rod shape-determining protein [Ornithinimicrobium sediminis]